MIKKTKDNRLPVEISTKYVDNRVQNHYNNYVDIHMNITDTMKLWI